MANLNTTIIATTILVALIFIGVPCLEAQSSPMGSPMMAPTSPTTTGPAPAPDCLTALSNVTDCLSFVATGSNMTAPDKACCPEFAGLLESNPICLCQLVGSSESYGVDLNRALMLPDACKVEIPSLESCPASPTPTPTSAPEPSSTGEAPGSTDGGAAPGPRTSGSNGATSTTVHDLSTFVCLAVAIFIAYYF